MRGILVLGGLVVGAVTCLALGGLAQEPGKPEGIAWRFDLAAARKEARDGGKPMFLVFRCET